MTSPSTHRRRGLLALPLLAALSLGACGSSGSSAPAGSSAGTGAAPPVTSSHTAAAATSAAAAGPHVGGVDLSQLAAKAKHLTPQQMAQIKANLPRYLKTQEACIRQVGSEAPKVLACLRGRGF